MTTKTFANFETRSPILLGDFLVGYKDDASKEIKVNFISLVQTISSLIVSENWDSVYSSVVNTSGNWDSVYSSVVNTSGNWDSVYSSVKDTSSNWDSTYTTVLTESASWVIDNSIDTEVRSLTSNWETTYNTVNTNSTDWDSAYSTILTYTPTNWTDTYTNVQSNSASYVTHTILQSNYLPLSGGVISTNLSVSGDYFNSEALTVFGNISASGSVYSSGNLEINGGSNTTLYVEDGLVGINTETPNESLTVFGNISASGSVYGNSLSLEADVEQPVKFLKSSSTLSLNPGVDVGVLRWESGTNAGTLKLVAYAGTSTTGVTVIDNVGSGNT